MLERLGNEGYGRYGLPMTTPSLLWLAENSELLIGQYMGYSDHKLQYVTIIHTWVTFFYCCNHCVK